MFLALAIKKAKYDALDLENYMPRHLIDWEKRIGISLPSIDKPVIVVIFRSVGLTGVKEKMNPLMEVAQSPKKLNIKAISIRISCHKKHDKIINAPPFLVLSTALGYPI